MRITRIFIYASISIIAVLLICGCNEIASTQDHDAISNQIKIEKNKGNTIYNNIGKVQAVSDDGNLAVINLIYTGGTGFSVIRTNTIKTLWESNTSEPINLAAFSPDGKKLAIVEREKDSEIHIWDVETGEKTSIIRDQRLGSITKLKFTPDGKYILSSNNLAFDAQLWSVESSSFIREYVNPKWYGVEGFSISPDNKKLALLSGHYDIETEGRILITFFDFISANILEIFHGDERDTYPVAISPNWSFIATAYNADDGFSSSKIKIIDINSKQILNTLSQPGDEAYQQITHLSFSPDNKYLVSINWHDVGYFWDVNNGKLLNNITYDHQGLNINQWLPTSDKFVTEASHDLIFWKIP